MKKKGWGGRKNYYGGDEISDDEDEDAKQMTEEALRQQKKHLQELQMDDYLDDDMQLDWQKKADVYDNKESENNKSTIEILKTDNSFENLNDDDKLKILKQSFPEFIPLLKEFTELKSKSQDFSKIDKNEIISIKIVALNAYLAALASYFAIFIDNLSNNNQDDAFISMKDNPIMETILSSREIWRQANELPEDAELPENKKKMFMKKYTNSPLVILMKMHLLMLKKNNLVVKILTMMMMMIKKKNQKKMITLILMLIQKEKSNVLV